MKKIIAVLIVITLMLTLCACTEPTGDVSSAAQVETIIIDDKNDEENNITSTPSSDIQSTQRAILRAISKLLVNGISSPR